MHLHGRENASFAELNDWQQWAQQEWTSVNGPQLPADPYASFAERAALLEAAIPAKDSTAQAWLQYGRICLAQHEQHKAGHAFATALSLQPDFCARSFS